MNLLLRALKAIIGLVLFSLGTYMTIQANIGFAPWDVFSMGISYHLPISYGDATTIISFIIILIIINLMKEKIGIGTILDAIIVGKSVDLFLYLEIIPVQNVISNSIVWLIVGLFVRGTGIWIYMSSALCCGPRDSLMIGIGRRLHFLSIGVVSIIIAAVILLVGWLLGGPVGIGTIIATFGQGITMQMVFNIVKFEPRNVEHESIIKSYNTIINSISIKLP